LTNSHNCFFILVLFFFFFPPFMLRVCRLINVHGNYIKFFSFNFVFFFSSIDVSIVSFMLTHFSFAFGSSLLFVLVHSYLFCSCYCSSFSCTCSLHKWHFLQNKNNCSQEWERFGQMQFLIHLRPFSSSLFFFFCCWRQFIFPSSMYHSFKSKMLI